MVIWLNAKRLGNQMDSPSGALTPFFMSSRSYLTGRWRNRSKSKEESTLISPAALRPAFVHLSLRVQLHLERLMAFDGRSRRPCSHYTKRMPLPGYTGPLRSKSQSALPRCGGGASALDVSEGAGLEDVAMPNARISGRYRITFPLEVCASRGWSARAHSKLSAAFLP